MKKITILFIIFALFASSCHSQKDDFIIIPLQVGENPNVPFGALMIYRIYVHYDSIPERENLPNIRVHIRLMERKLGGGNITERMEFIYFYDERLAARRNSRLRAFGNFIIGLKVNENGIHLVVETLEFSGRQVSNSGVVIEEFEFGEEFYMPRYALVGDLLITVRYEGHSHGWFSPNPEDTTTCGYFRMFLSVGNKEKRVPFEICSHQPKPNPSLVEWRNYRIDILNAEKFKVTKTSRRYNPRFQRFRQSARNVYSRFAETIAFFVSNNNRNETFEIHATDVRWAADDIATVKAKDFENGIVIAEAAFENNGFVLHLPNHLSDFPLHSLDAEVMDSDGRVRVSRRNVKITYLDFLGLSAYNENGYKIGYIYPRSYRVSDRSFVAVDWIYVNRRVTVRETGKDFRTRIRLQRGWNKMYGYFRERRGREVWRNTTQKPFFEMNFEWRFREKVDEIEDEYDFYLPPCLDVE